MHITEVRIKLMDDPHDRLQAFCSITLDGSFVIRDLKIIQGTKGSFVAMPSRKLTDRCPKCHSKNHLRSLFCNQCGNQRSIFFSSSGTEKGFCSTSSAPTATASSRSSPLIVAIARMTCSGHLSLISTITSRPFLVGI